MRRFLLTILMILLAVTAAYSQELRLVVSDKPLGYVLNTLGLEVSYDDAALSRYRLTISRTFATPEEALFYLLKDKPFEIERVGSVYVVTPRAEVVPAKSEKETELREKSYHYSCTLTDAAGG